MHSKAGVYCTGPNCFWRFSSGLSNRQLTASEHRPKSTCLSSYIQTISVFTVFEFLAAVVYGYVWYQ